MKKIILKFVFTICLIFPCSFLLSACDNGLTDCAYLQFIPSNDKEVVLYTSQMYDSPDYSHIYLFESEQAKNIGKAEENYLLKISFNRNLGIDNTVDKKETLCVSIEGWTSMKISIKESYYDSSKKVYLNGKDITSKANSTLSKPPEEGSTSLGSFWFDGVYYFEDFGLIQGNKNNFINKIEYR